MLPRIANRADYNRLRKTFQWDRREQFNFGVDVVDHWAAKKPDDAALWLADVHGVQQRKWSEISLRSSQVASALMRLGLQRGERVLVMLPKTVEWWESLVGLLKAGLVALPWAYRVPWDAPRAAVLVALAPAVWFGRALISSALRELGARRPVVTAAFDEMAFHAPIQVGQMALIRARLTLVDRSSMEIRVDVQSEDLLTGERRRTGTAYVTFVALDPVTRRPTPAPPLELETEEERAEHARALERRRQRLEHRRASRAS